MSYASEREEQLKKKIIPQTIPADFEDFWQRALAQLRAVPIQVKREKLVTPYDKFMNIWELRYNTHDDTWVSAYFTQPKGLEGKLPCVVHFHGGSEKKNIFPQINNTGVCCLSIDVRSQGGQTIDKADYKTGDVNGGLMTRGMLDKEEFYMRNIFLDAVRAVDVAATFEEVDPQRIVTWGGSQGGALTIVAAALSGKVKKAFPVMTSFCNLRRRVELASGIYGSVNSYLKKYPHNTDKVMETLPYFDILNMVSLLKVPVDFAMGLGDTICLPEFVYSAYSHTASTEKTVQIFPFVPHTFPEAFVRYAHGEFAKL